MISLGRAPHQGAYACERLTESVWYREGILKREYVKGIGKESLFKIFCFALPDVYIYRLL